MSISNLEALAIGWKAAKDAEASAKEQRLQIEEQILTACGGEKKFFDLSISYRENRKWDNDGLTALREKITPEAFPFRIEYKENLSESRALAKIDPEFWRKHFAPLLTITPAKPTFTWKEKK